MTSADGMIKSGHLLNPDFNAGLKNKTGGIRFSVDPQLYIVEAVLNFYLWRLKY